MKLQDIRLRADEICENGLNFPFNWSCHHVIEPFLHFLPPKFELNDASVVEIDCSAGSERALDYEEPVLGGCSVDMIGFDFVRYKAASPGERERIILDLIADCLVHIGERHGAEVGKIHETTALVRERAFELSIPVKRLSRWSKDRKVQMRVQRILSAEMGESWSAEIFYKETGETKPLWLTSHPDYLENESRFRKSAFVDGKFFIRDSREDVLEIDPEKMTVKRCGWATPLVEQRKSRRYDQHKIDVAARAERAASGAGRAFKSGNYADVVALLGPYEKHLSGKNLTRLVKSRHELGGDSHD